MTRLICCAAGEFDWSSVVPQTGHITSPSSSRASDAARSRARRARPARAATQDEQRARITTPRSAADTAAGLPPRSSWPTTFPSRSTKKICGIGSPPHVASTSPLPSWTLGIRDAVLALPAARLAGEVLRVDADERDAVAVTLAAPPASRFDSWMHGSHHDAQKSSTTGFLPRSDERSIAPSPSRRFRSKTGAVGVLAASRAPCETFSSLSCATRHTSSAEQTDDEADRERLRRQPGGPRHQAETMKTGVPIVDVVEQPLGLRDVHADAAVRDRVADRPVGRRAVDADAGRGESHPARAERIVRARRDRLLALRPRGVRRIPPRVPPLDDDPEAAERRRVCASGRSRRRTTRTSASRCRASAGSSRAGSRSPAPKFLRVNFGRRALVDERDRLARRRSPERASMSRTASRWLSSARCAPARGTGAGDAAKAWSRPPRGRSAARASRRSRAIAAGDDRRSRATRRVGLRGERPRDRLVDDRRRAEDVRGDEHCVVPTLELERLRERLLHGLRWRRPEPGRRPRCPRPSRRRATPRPGRWSASVRRGERAGARRRRGAPAARRRRRETRFTSVTVGKIRGSLVMIPSAPASTSLLRQVRVVDRPDVDGDAELVGARRSRPATRPNGAASNAVAPERRGAQAADSAGTSRATRGPARTTGASARRFEMPKRSRGSV